MDFFRPWAAGCVIARTSYHAFYVVGLVDVLQELASLSSVVVLPSIFWAAVAELGAAPRDPTACQAGFNQYDDHQSGLYELFFTRTAMDQRACWIHYGLWCLVYSHKTFPTSNR